ncbi:MAG: efflux transporter outer membrane subunit [Verrucomicrobiales bacterium]|nr:efflux transporter outer membrane subunit [Verrucomicrobiales bacterium]
MSKSPTTAPAPSGYQVLIAGILSLVAFLPGCALWETPKVDPAAVVGNIPSRWTSGGGAIPGLAVTGWLADFGSPPLNVMVEEAIGRNYDLASARARVRQARERASIAGADRLPTLDAGVQTTRSQNLRGAAFQTVRANNFNFNLNLAWEVDLWGRLKNLRDAELDRFSAESSLYEASRLSLAGNVVKTAFEIIEGGEQIELARRTLASLRTNLKILDAKLEAGDAADRAALDVSLTRADVARAESAILVFQRRVDAAKRTLETLLGRYPAGTIEALSGLPRINREVPAGLPTELLLRRPDLLAAEARVDAAMKDLSASRKALLPALSITGDGGTASTDDFGDLFNIQNLVWGIGQNLTRPLYQGGRLKANIRLDEDQRDELIASYAETALTAFREVETALSAERYLKAQVGALSTAVSESRRAETLSLGDYQQGLVDIITLLESQRRSFDAQSALLTIKLALIVNRVDLYLALGGDFDHAPTDKGVVPATPVP